ncbi:hypothetical protein RchiOBHm_Chr4g0394351 [Rosa chinensis]|uniref:Non-specific serine/threonine protein kinase n=1 Tax=Rosa chinensis TaxID=74649 RepID=A0A2P6QR78_ROSCH|nr:hypothetical protein RchiOBHm_Chr4g0394351 [Rosa chinensis]
MKQNSLITLLDLSLIGFMGSPTVTSTAAKHDSGSQFLHRSQT